LYDDGKTAYPAEAFAHMTDRSIEEMMKTVTSRLLKNLVLERFS
jgi:hypothetical protein